MTRPNVTPGTWTQSGATIPSVEAKLPTGQVVTLARMNYGWGLEARDNASAIAALPECLAALEFALADLQLISDEQGGSYGKTCDAIISALTKAGYTF